MKTLEENVLTLGNFEGPIDFLLSLVQKSEIDVSEIALRDITKQYIQYLDELLSPNLDGGAEFVGATASLLLIKSKTLLPHHDQSVEAVEELPDPRFDVIHHLIDYCRFKEVAKVLREKEEEQGTFYARGALTPELKKTLGVDHLSLSDLATLFQQVLAKATSAQGLIQEEVWRVTDKMQLVRRLLNELCQIKFGMIFSSSQCREELITTFLAVLELMKQGEMCIVRDRETAEIMIVKTL